MTLPRDPLLIFDIGNVMLRHDNDLLARNLANACADPEAILPTILAKIDEAGQHDGKYTGVEFFERLKPLIGFQGDFTAFESLWSSHFSHDGEMEELVEVLASLYRLVTLSNSNELHWRYLLAEYPVMHVPAKLYASFEMGLQKPDLAIYRAVLEAEQRQPEDAIFVDDRAENVAAASTLGIHGILFKDRLQLESDLADLGIAFER